MFLSRRPPQVLLVDHKNLPGIMAVGSVNRLKAQIMWRLLIDHGQEELAVEQVAMIPRLLKLIGHLVPPNMEYNRPT